MLRYIEKVYKLYMGASRRIIQNKKADLKSAFGVCPTKAMPQNQNKKGLRRGVSARGRGNEMTAHFPLTISKCVEI
jgi:hypothetical protein